MQASKSILGQN